MSLSTGAIATIATVMVMAGLPASILGNEIATRLGRRFTLAAMMTASAATALLLAFTSGGPLPLVLALTSLYAVLVMSDSAAITVGTIASAPVERRGATIAVQTLMASLMAMIAPLACGWSLDLFGGESRWGWGIALAIMGGGALFGALGVARVGGRREKA